MIRCGFVATTFLSLRHLAFSIDCERTRLGVAMQAVLEINNFILKAFLHRADIAKHIKVDLWHFPLLCPTRTCIFAKADQFFDSTDAVC